MDPRQGLPSASASERYHHCDGSFLASTGMPETTNEDAEAGTRIHYALADWFRSGLAFEYLKDDELHCAQACVSLVDDLLHDQFHATLEPGIATAKVALVEKRLWLLDGHQKLGSGQCDVCFMLPDAWLIVDFKSGRQQTSPAERNYQLRSLVGILRQSLGDDTDDENDIYAAIIAPWQSPNTTVVKYDYHESLIALQATQELFRKAIAGGPRTPGDWCKFCPALGNCPEAQQKALATIPVLPVVVSDDTIEKAVSLLSGSKLTEFLDQADFAEDVIAAAKAEAKRRLEADPSSLPGYTLKPGNWIETVTDIQTVYARFLQGAASESEKAHRTTLFMQTVKCTKGALEDAQKAITGAKGDELKRQLSELLAGCTEKSQNKPSLARIKE